MRSFRASGSWVPFDCGSMEVNTWVGTVRVDVIASGIFAHGGCGRMKRMRGLRAQLDDCRSTYLGQYQYADMPLLHSTHTMGLRVNFAPGGTQAFGVEDGDLDSGSVE